MLPLHVSLCVSKRNLLFKNLTRLPWWLSGEESACQCRRLGFDSWVKKTPLEEEMANHSSILAWEIPWTEEPGGLQFMQLQKSWM